MLADPSQALTAYTIGEVITIFRDAAFLIGIAYFGWRARSWIRPAEDFCNLIRRVLKRADLHMTTMESKMDMLLDNHLEHLGEDVSIMSGRKTRSEVDNESLES
jgi:hypothetical protein